MGELTKDFFCSALVSSAASCTVSSSPSLQRSCNTCSSVAAWSQRRVEHMLMAAAMMRRLSRVSEEDGEKESNGDHNANRAKD